MTALPQAIAFDLYDTLVTHDWRSHARFVAHELGVPEAAVIEAYDVGRDHRDEGAGADSADVLADVGAHCGVERSRQEWEDLAWREAELLAGAVQVYDDSVAVLHQLRADGVKTAVVSNCGPSTRPVVDHLRFADLVDAIVLSCEVKVSKPAPGIFRLALGELDVSAGDCWFVDDRGDYLDGAKAVGMGTVRIAREQGFGQGVEGGDHRVVSTLDEIFRLF